MCDYWLVNTSFIYFIFTKIVITALTILSLLFTVVTDGTTIDPIKLSTNRRVELITADRFIYVLIFIQFRKKLTIIFVYTLIYVFIQTVGFWWVYHLWNQ